MLVLSIDPGLGGAALLQSEHEIVDFFVMPTIRKKKKGTNKHETLLDVPSIVDSLRHWNETYEITDCALEKVHAMPSQGVSSVFKFGQVYGTLQGVLESLGISYELIPPQTWTKVIHEGLERDITSKERSMIAFELMYPDVDLRRNKRCKNNHDGLVDAALIGKYLMERESK